MNAFHRALLQYRNCPSPDTGSSPASCLFGHPTRDLLPGIPKRFRPHHDWDDRMDQRERALSRRRIDGRARWDEHTQGLTPLKCGDTVLVQNQTGRHPTKWDKSGTVVEVLQFHQYAVRTDGSGRLTTRNRRYLRKYDPLPYAATQPNRRPLPHTPLIPPPPPQSDLTQPQQPAATDPARHPASLAPPTPAPIAANQVPQPGSPIPTPAPTQPPPLATQQQQPTQPPPRQPLLATPTPPSTPHPSQSRSYASVAKTPHRPQPLREKQTAVNILGRMPPYPPPPPEPRRSKRGPKPVDRYGH